MLDEKLCTYIRIQLVKAVTRASSANITGTSLHESIKCIFHKRKKSGKNFVIHLLAHQKLDMNAISEVLQEKYEFEKKEKILEKFDVEI